MVDQAQFLLPVGVVVLGWILADGSPGPATLRIFGTGMSRVRLAGVSFRGVVADLRVLAARLT